MESGKCKRLIVCEPPGSAKSTYISDLFPGWFLARKPNRCILATSYKLELIESFGRRARDRIHLNSLVLGMDLKGDSRAAGEWETTNGGRYFCAGTNAGIAGHRADVAFIDDPIGSEEDARSENFREKLWQWFWNDFMPRLRPDGAVVIIANRRHVDDLVGRLLAKYPQDWKVLNLLAVIETAEDAAADPLGRPIGGLLWPEWFNGEWLADARKNDNFHGLFQQKPVPDSGNMILKEWLNACEYTPDQLPSNLRHYGCSDHATGTSEEGDASCLMCPGVDSNGVLWIPADIVWDYDKPLDTMKLVEVWFRLVRKFNPVEWWAEDDHIRKAIGPFMRQKMRDESLYFVVTPLASVRDLRSRSTSIRGRIAEGMVRFPKWAPWWPMAKKELLEFDKGKHDDFLACISEVGRGLDSITRPAKVHVEEDVLKSLAATKGFGLTMGQLKDLAAKADKQPRYGDR